LYEYALYRQTPWQNNERRRRVGRYARTLRQPPRDPTAFHDQVNGGSGGSGMWFAPLTICRMRSLRRASSVTIFAHRCSALAQSLTIFRSAISLGPSFFGRQALFGPVSFGVFFFGTFLLAMSTPLEL